MYVRKDLDTARAAHWLAGFLRVQVVVSVRKVGLKSFFEVIVGL